MTKVMPLKERMNSEIIPALQKELGVNIHEVPQIEKIIVNVGVGTLFQADKKNLDFVVENITAITGQKPVVVNSKKAISNFKLRIGMPVGVKATLRGERMLDFLNKLVNVIFPRIRDFQGFTTRAFDGQGNLTIGLKEHTVFPEVKLDDQNRSHGLQIIFQTNVSDDKVALELFKALHFPFRETKKQSN